MAGNEKNIIKRKTGKIQCESIYCREKLIGKANLHCV